MQGSITVTLDSLLFRLGNSRLLDGAWSRLGPLLDGPPQPREMAESARPFFSHPLSTEEEKGKLEGVSILAAARADQVAWEHQGQGAFTAAWVGFWPRAIAHNRRPITSLHSS